MVKKETRVKVLIPYIWDLFKRYLNNTGIILKTDDVLADLFMRGENDVKEFVDLLNKKASKQGYDIYVKYEKRLTYKQILLQI